MIDEKKALDMIAQGEGQQIEFKENIPSKVRELSEEVCAFANASGGFIFIGITNKNEFSKGFSIDNSKRSSIQDSLSSIQPELESEFYPLNVTDHPIWVIEVPEGNEKPYFVSGSVYVRNGANSQKLRKPSDVRQFFEDTGSLHYDEASCKWFSPNDISDQAVKDFKEQAGITSKASNLELIRNLELLDSHGGMTNVVPMFFSDACGKSIPQAIIRCFRFKGKDKVHIIDSKTFRGPILDQYNGATNWLKEKLSVEYIMDGFNPRKEKWEQLLMPSKKHLPTQFATETTMKPEPQSLLSSTTTD